MDRITATEIERSFRLHGVLIDLEIDGTVLRDASLEDVEHYFIYRADEHAEAFLS